MQVTFEPVMLNARKTFVCVDCGKTRERSYEFSQTINPFNTNAAGQVKTRHEIMEELKDSRDAWQPVPSCGCVERAARDERPDKRTVDVDAPIDLATWIERSAAIASAKQDLNNEIAAHCVGMEVVWEGRPGCYITRAYTDRSWNGVDRILCEVWVPHKNNPKLQHGDVRYGEDLAKVLEASRAAAIAAVVE